MFKSILMSLILFVSSGVSLASAPMTPANNSVMRVITLNADNTIAMRGPIMDDMVRRTQLKLLELDAKRGNKNYPLYLVIDSPGGSIDAGNDFIEVAKTIKNLKTIVLFAASMASAIQQSIPGERLITESGIDMFHRAAGSFDGQFEDGEVESRLDLAKQIVRNLERTNANRIGISIPEYKAKVVNEWWAVGSNAVKANMADAVVSVQCSKELLQSKDSVAIQTLFFTAKFSYNSCPLIRAGEPASREDSDLFNKFKNLLDAVTKKYLRLM